MGNIKNRMMAGSAAAFIGMVAGVENAFAAGTGPASGKTFTDIILNIGQSIEGVPGLISGTAYLMGLLLGVLGILKIKDHVENPAQTPLQHGAIRLAAGGGLFALPIVYEAMRNTVGTDSDPVEAPRLKAPSFRVYE